MDWDNFCSLQLLGKYSSSIPDVLKMIERCSDISSVSSLRILVGMLFGPADFFGLKLKIISIISSFVQGEMKNDSWLGGGKYSEKLLYENGTSD